MVWIRNLTEIADALTDDKKIVRKISADMKENFYNKTGFTDIESVCIDMAEFSRKFRAENNYNLIHLAASPEILRPSGGDKFYSGYIKFYTAMEVPLGGDTAADE